MSGPDLIPLEFALPPAVVERIALLAIEAAAPPEVSRRGLAKHLLASRRRRERTFPDVRFGEPSWDMILDLYVATADDKKVDVSGLYLASGVAPTTAVRYVEMLTESGYLVRHSDKSDGRRTFITMSDRLRLAIERWLDGELATLRLMINAIRPT